MKRNELKTTEDFINRSKEIYKDLFEYDKTEFIDLETPIILKCKRCGNYFEVIPSNHLGTLSKKNNHNTIGCPSCVKKNLDEQKRLKSFNNWINKAIQLFQDSFNYSEVDYIDRFTPVKILCNHCNRYFWQTPEAHLKLTNKVCPKCTTERIAKEQSNGIDLFIQKAEQIHGKERYDYSKVRYVNRTTPVRILDKFNNVDFLITPYNFLRGLSYETKGRSGGEELIYTWMNSNSELFYYKREVSTNINKINIRIDYIIYSKKDTNITYWIEYNGEQHYNLKSMIFLTDGRGIRTNISEKSKREGLKKYKKQLKRDENVRKYCKENNIILIEIPYTYNTYEKISEVLKRILIEGESPDIITQPKIIQPT